MQIEHDCLQDERIRDLKCRVDKLEERSDNFKETLLEIKQFQSRLMWTLVGSMGITILNLVVLLVKK